jgi:tetratricopeptide (TPR) repeat protein
VYPFRFSYVADHFEYLASLGIIVPASFLLTAAAARISSRKLIRLAVPGLLLLLLGTLTWRQSAVYQDAETLYRATLARNPATFMGQNNLCRILTETGRLDEAIAHCEAALRIKPGYVEAHIGLGNAWAQMPNRLPDAEQAYEAALRTWPDSKEAHLGLGNVLAQLPGRVPDAIAEFQTALRIDPGYFEAHFNLAYALSEIPGRKSDAIAECEAAIRLRPDLDRPRELLQELRNSGR